jgi:hypothetical protein
MKKIRRKNKEKKKVDVCVARSFNPLRPHARILYLGQKSVGQLFHFLLFLLFLLVLFVFYLFVCFVCCFNLLVGGGGLFSSSNETSI